MRIVDHFELGEEPWVQLEGDDGDECWVSRLALEPPSGSDDCSDGEDDDGALLRLEFDLPADQMSWCPVEDLLDAGLLAIIEPGEVVVGLALEIDPAEVRRVSMLVGAHACSEAILEEQIGQALRDAAARRPAHRILDPYRRQAGTPEQVPAEVTLVDY